MNLVIYRCHGNENQQFQLRDMGDGYFQIVSRPGGKCLDVAGLSKDNGAAIHYLGLQGVGGSRQGQPALP